MRLIYLLLTAGLCSGLQTGLQYTYHYRARVTSGIPEINNKRSAAVDVRADLIVSAPSPRKVIFKLENVESASFTGLSDCPTDDMNEPLPTDYWPAAALGQHEFALDGLGQLVFSEDDKNGTINFYKSIMQIFTIIPLKETFFGEENKIIQRPSYTTTETTDSIMGTCELLYTQYHLSGTAAAQHLQFYEDHVEDDCQLQSQSAALTSKTRKTTGRKVPGRKTRPSKTSPQVASCPSIEKDVYKLTRSIDLAACSDRVEYQHYFSLSGLPCDMSKDQCQNLFSRNSHGTYFLRGDAEAMRVEKAEIKGTIVLSPYGYETEEKLVSVSQQKIALVSVRPIAADIAMNFPTKTLDSLVFNMVVPSSVPTDSFNSWSTAGSAMDVRESITGQEISQYPKDLIVGLVIETINAASTMLNSTEPRTRHHEASAMLSYCGTLMYGLSADEYKKVYDGLDEDKRHFLYSIAAINGVNESLEFVFDNINKMSTVQQILIFGSLNTHLKSPDSLRRIMDYVKEQDMTSSPFKTSQILVNFATLVHRVCGTSSSVFSARLNRLQCEVENIIPDFEAFLITELESSSKFWKQMVLAKALVNLKTIGATNALLPYILAKEQCDPMVRSIAMDALASWNAADYREMNKIMHTLLDIYENPAESRELRSRALGYLVSWPLKSTGWTRLAYNTWRPGFRDLSALTYSLIKATAEVEGPDMLQRRQMAQHALTQARPCSRAERYSSFKFWARYNFFDQIGALDYLSVFKDPGSPLPSEMVAYMQRNLGGSTFHRKMEFMISNDHGEIDTIIKNIFRGVFPDRSDPPNTGRWSDYIKMLKRDLNIEEKVQGMVRGLTSLMTVSGTELFVPLESEMLQDLAKLFLGPLTGSSSTLYLNSMDFVFASVNDLGLPVLVSTAAPMTVSYTYEMELSDGVHMQLAEVELKIRNARFLYARQNIVSLTVSVPPLGLQISTGVTNSLVVHLPFSPQLRVAMDAVDYEPQSVFLSLESSVDDKVALLMNRNTPFAFAKEYCAPRGYRDDLYQYSRPIFVGERPIYKVPILLPFNLEFVTYGDVQPPQNRGEVFDIFTGKSGDLEKVILMSPTAKFNHRILMMNMTDFKSGSLTFNFTKEHLERSPNAGKLVSMYGQDKFEDYELCGQTGGDFTQQSTGQQTGDYDYSQTYQNPQEEFDSFGSIGGFEGSAQSPQEAPAKLTESQAETVRHSQASDNYFDVFRQMTGRRENMDIYSLKMELVYPGGASRETAVATFAKTTCYSYQDKKNTKLNFHVYVDGYPNMNMCLDLDVVAPKINDLDTLETLRVKNFTQKFITEARTGHNCEKFVASTLEYIEVSQSSVDDLIHKLKKRSCSQQYSGDLLADFQEEFHYDKIHLVHKEMHREFKREYPTTYAAFALHDYLIEKYIHLKMNPPSNTQEETYKVELNAEWTQGDEMKLSQSYNDGPPAWQTIKSTNFLKQWSDFTAADYCVVDDHRVHTFDGLEANVTIEDCPILLATPCEKYEQELFAIAVKRDRDGQLAVNIVSQSKELVISVDGRGVKINGDLMDPELYVKPISFDPRGRVSANIYRRNGFIKVEVIKNFDVLIKENKIYVKVDDQFRGMMCGLCGNMDLEPSNDLVCPKNCALTNSDNFSKAWTPATGFDCYVGFQSGEDCLKVAEPLDENYYNLRLFGE